MTTSKRGPRLADVATRAGVSISTVSKVINGGTDVAEATRARVEALLDDASYVRRARSGPPASIGVLVQSLTLPSTAEIITGALAEAHNSGVRLWLLSHDDAEPAARWLDQISAKSTNALIAIHSVLDREQRALLDERNVPLVVINPKDLPHLGAHSVGATNWTGGVSAAEHLLGLGHRQIAVLAGDDESMIGRARVSGFQEAARAGGISVTVLGGGRFTFASGLERGRDALLADARPSAVFAASDEQARGAIEAARQLGLLVPDDVSIVGFDDLAVAATTSPPLTTVRQPLHQMGGTAVQVALDLIGSRLPQSHHLELATSLIVRQSTAEPRRV